MTKITFTVYGNPVAKARARTVRRGGRVSTYTPEKTKTWEEMIRLQILEHRPEKLIDGALTLRAIFYLQRGGSLPKKRIYPETKPDLDNLLKCLTDAMEGVIYSNDSRIVNEVVGKRYGDPPRVEVWIREMVTNAPTRQ